MLRLFLMGLVEFSDNKFSDTKFSEANFPKPHFPKTNILKDIFFDDQNYNKLIIEPNLT